MEVADIRMLRWSCRVVSLNRPKYNLIRNTYKVSEVGIWKGYKRRLQWYGHAKKRDESYVGISKNIFFFWEYRGKKQARKGTDQGKDGIKNYYGKIVGIVTFERKILRWQNRADWKRLTRNAIPFNINGKRWWNWWWMNATNSRTEICIMYTSMNFHDVFPDGRKIFCTMHR